MISEDHLHAFFNILPIGLWQQGQDRKFAWTNDAFSQITGFTLEELRAKETIELIRPCWRQFVIDRNRAILEGDILAPYYFPTRTKDKRELIVMGVIGRIGDRYYGGYIAPIFIDQERDALSGLYNEIHFYRTLRSHIEECYRHERPPFTMMAIGIDAFKEHRQTLGLMGMDRFVRLIANKILALTSGDDLPARIADGQFDILFPGPIVPEHWELAQTLVDFAAREARANLNLAITISIAVVAYDENVHGNLDRKLISHAHRAMFRTQAQGGGAVVVAPDP